MKESTTLDFEIIFLGSNIRICSSLPRGENLIGKKKTINEQKYEEQTVARIICNLTLSFCQWQTKKFSLTRSHYCQVDIALYQQFCLYTKSFSNKSKCINNSSKLIFFILIQMQLMMQKSSFLMKINILFLFGLICIQSTEKYHFI